LGCEPAQPASGFIMALLVFYAWSAPHAFSLFILVLYGLGLTLFLSAKISQIRNGVLISFGSSRMSVSSRHAYRAGYFPMFFGIAAGARLVPSGSWRLAPQVVLYHRGQRARCRAPIR
jgi:hypothetical protein